MKHRLISTSKSADDFLESLPPKQFKQVFTKIWNLRKNPQPTDSSKLQGYKDKLRVDIGEYRVIYSFDHETIFIEVAGKRNDDEVYKKLKK
jgi:mRNA interferase RelE/StbE